MTTDTVLRFRGIDHEFAGRGVRVHALRDVSLSVRRGETLSVVGESGCGKSTLARVAVRLYQPTGGTLEFHGQDLTRAYGRALRPLRRGVQMVFQDPNGSLDPRLTIRRSVTEPLQAAGMAAPDRQRRAREVLEQVGLPAEALDSYPHEFSGGQRQRIALARALAPRPELVVLDEPTSALDVSVQAQILNLLREMQAAQSLAYLFISHNLGVVRYLSDRVAVMYLGEVVELARTDELFAGPQHPYTVALLSAVLEPEAGAAAPRRTVLRGELPSAAAVPAGCAFAARCWLATDRCRTERPALVEAAPGRQVACHRPGEATLTDVPRSPAAATTTTK
jgi:oligopeptide/dipeptide ABC transporter ATP-binding protein